MQLSKDPLIPADVIQERVRELARQISRDYRGEMLVLVVVLRGSMIFAADLMRQLDLEVHLEFIRAKSYDGAKSSGWVEFSMMPEEELQGRHVLIIEDILDTGTTCTAIMGKLQAFYPASLAICTLLDKPSRRVVEMTGDYVGFTIDDHFVVGYGLDYEENYRQLPEVYTLEP